MSWVASLPWKVIKEVANEAALDETLLSAFIHVESSNNKWAYRFEPAFKWVIDTDKHAKANGLSEASERNLQMSSFGLTQVMGGVARELGLTGSIFQLLDEKTNLLFCSKLLKKHLKKYSLLDDVIASYNAGSPRKDASGRYVNQSYVDKINSARVAIALYWGNHGKTS